jgi:hypothetical protein
LLVLLAALGGAFGAAVLVNVREGLVRTAVHPDPFEGFEIETFAPPEDFEPWLPEAHGIERGVS